MSSDDDQDVFEITDFTTVSDWERFIAQIEEVIHEWRLTANHKKPNLTKEELINGTWHTCSETLNFVKFDFVVTRHYLEQDETNDCCAVNQDDDEDDEPLPLAMSDMMCSEHDFLNKGHVLAQWYGLRDFVILRAIFQEGVNTETRAKLLLSSIAVALNNTNCQIPMFLQIHNKDEDYYLGICQGSNVKTNYEMVFLRRIPNKYNHLSGLMDVFKSKIASPLKDKSQDATVSAMLSYTLDDWTFHSWPQCPPDMDLFMGEVGVNKLGELPHGACEDPISRLHLITTWSSLSERIISDNAVFSILDPMHAPEWRAKLSVKPNLQCLLFDYLSDFKALCTRKETSAAVLGHDIEEPDPIQSAKITNALDRLTDPMNIPTISSVVSKARTRVQSNQDKTPIPTDLLIKILQFIFPDAVSGGKIIDEDLPGISDESLNNEIQDQLKSLKSAPESALASRLALAMCHVNHSYGGLNGVAHLWQEFVLEMRYRWENHITLPCVEPGTPNFRYCLLHQKLQMLNCCIIKKKTREMQLVNKSSASSSMTTSNTSVEEASESDNDEFYECFDNIKNDEVAEDGAAGKSRESTPFQDSTSVLPEGRLRKCADLKLLNSDDPLYIPITQEPAPMTEDLLEEHAKVLVQLGTDQEGAQLRAKMQSTCLTSDMEAFKAANPNAKLEDFVRWYSPRDWIEEEVVDPVTGQSQTKGELSARMKIPGNMWYEVWTNSKAVPARKQKRLFDDTKEAEKVLHFLSSLTPAQIAFHLFPMIIHSSLITIMKHCDRKLKSLSLLLDATINRATKVTRSPMQDINMYEDLIKMIGTAETFIARVQSVKAKFIIKENEETKFEDVDETKSGNDDENEVMNSFIYDILEGKEVDVVNTWQSSVGQAITKLFTDAYKAANLISDKTPNTSEESQRYSQSEAGQQFPAPNQREFIIRTMAARPAAYSTPSPQRMHCILSNQSFRIAAAFSEDTLFQ